MTFQLTPVQREIRMTHPPRSPAACNADVVSDHYRRAAEQLLYAYQRNKEAKRFHEAGAYRAAAHHAELSRNHSLMAHEHLQEVVHLSEEMRVNSHFPTTPSLPSRHRNRH